MEGFGGGVFVGAGSSGAGPGGAVVVLGFISGGGGVRWFVDVRVV